MNTKAEDRLLGLAVAALAATIGGELLGSQLLVTVGVAGFAVALLALFAVMGVVLAVSVARSPELNGPDSTATGRVR
jgi:O-antigen ligase